VWRTAPRWTMLRQYNDLSCGIQMQIWSCHKFKVFKYRCDVNCTSSGVLTITCSLISYIEHSSGHHFCHLKWHIICKFKRLWDYPKEDPHTERQFIATAAVKFAYKQHYSPCIPPNIPDSDKIIIIWLIRKVVKPLERKRIETRTHKSQKRGRLWRFN
jgi:hypothetical protein